MELTQKALDFSRNNILKYGESNLLFRSFEYEIIFNNWEDFCKEILTSDLSKFPINKQRIYAVPKANGKFRIISKLDPVDLIILTAIVFEISESIENYRLDVSLDAIFSYRTLLTEEGSFYSKEIGYQDFISKINDYSKKFNYCLKTDFVDFYNQIYIHRVQNAIAFDADFKSHAKYLGKFLMKLNDGVSQGIPVGPQATHILAESILIDVDQLIASKNIDFVRYSDDIYMFSNESSNLVSMLSDLTKYLYTVHRISFSSEKTKLMTTIELQKGFSDPLRLESKKLHEKIEEMNRQLFEDFEMEFEESYNPYYFGYSEEFFPKNFEDLELKEKYSINENTLLSMFEENSTSDIFDLSIHKHIISKLKQMRSDKGVAKILEPKIFEKSISGLRLNLDYVIALVSNEDMENYISNIEMIITSDYSEVDYFVDILGYFIALYPIFKKSRKIMNFLKKTPLRYQVLFAERNGDIAFIRRMKDRIDEFTTWDRRAIIYACRILPSDELENFNRYSRNRDDFLETKIFNYIRNI